VQIECVGERERNGGWSFDLQALDADGVLHRYELTLAWADYNLWSASGADRPAAVAVAALAFLLDRRAPDELRPRFDAAIARRIDAAADREIPGLIR
jgi:hypothetical protein